MLLGGVMTLNEAISRKTSFHISMSVALRATSLAEGWIVSNRGHRRESVHRVRPVRYVHGFLLLGSSMELYIFDRSGAYGATPFDIHDEPERFVRVMSAYVLMNDEELGLDTFIERADGKQFVTVTEEGQRKRRRLQLEARPIAVQAAIVCRGTCCYRTADSKRVVKFSWRSDKRLAEAELLRRAH